MKRNLLLTVFISFMCLSLLAQPGTQTRTAHSINQFGEAVQQLWANISVQSLEADDDIYAVSKRLSKGRTGLPLLLKDFQFSIPANATIDNIVVSVRRFKTGRGSVHDYFGTLVRAGAPGQTNYGIWWMYTDPYPGTEMLFTYSEPGMGTNGGPFGTTPFTWTPVMINDPAFGFRLEIMRPSGSVKVFYDQVTITVNYTVPAILTQVPPERTSLKQPLVYPNPFTSTTLLQFTAAETGNAIIEVFDIAGRKCETIFSQAVIEGLSYTSTAAGNMLTKGIYFYRIINGSQSFTGKMIKLE